MFWGLMKEALEGNQIIIQKIGGNVVAKIGETQLFEVSSYFIELHGAAYQPAWRCGECRCLLNSDREALEKTLENEGFVGDVNLETANIIKSRIEGVSIEHDTRIDTYEPIQCKGEHYALRKK